MQNSQAFACQSFSTVQLCGRRAQLRSHSEDGRRKLCFSARAEEGNSSAQVDFLAAAQTASYPNKQQDVTQDAREAEVYRYMGILLHLQH